MDFTVSGVSATTQVRAVRPWHPWEENVLRSAWIPAPDEQSEPAMLSAIDGVIIDFIYYQEILRYARHKFLGILGG